MSENGRPLMTLEALRSVPLFASLGDESAGALRELLELELRPAGSVLFRKGERGGAMYLIEDGRVRIHIKDRNGDDVTLRQRVTRNLNEVEEERQTFADRMADAVSEFGGSWKFIAATVAFIVFWVVYNTTLRHDQGIDPFPYSFLDVMNGIVAALLTPIILISQNRQGEKDRLRADLDYQVNLKNELALAELLRRLDLLESERLPLLFSKLREEGK